jgi:hypothetical protein
MVGDVAGASDDQLAAPSLPSPRRSRGALNHRGRRGRRLPAPRPEPRAPIRLARWDVHRATGRFSNSPCASEPGAGTIRRSGGGHQNLRVLTGAASRTVALTVAQGQRRDQCRFRPILVRRVSRSPTEAVEIDRTRGSRCMGEASRCA